MRRKGREMDRIRRKKKRGEDTARDQDGLGEVAVAEMPGGGRGERTRGQAEAVGDSVRHTDSGVDGSRAAGQAEGCPSECQGWRPPGMTDREREVTQQAVVALASGGSSAETLVHSPPCLMGSQACVAVGVSRCHDCVVATQSVWAPL